MKKTALIKTSLREIRQSTTRFLSIMGIIFLGVMVFVGLKATGPDMIKTANNYYQKEQLPDARIISTMGLEERFNNTTVFKRCRNSCAAVYNRCHDWAAK